MTIGEKIRKLRNDQDMTAADLSRKTGIPCRVIYSWEREERSPTLDNAAKVANALGISVDQLIDR